MKNDVQEVRTTGDIDGFWLRQARDAYSASTTFFDTNVRSRIIQDIRQFQGEHPEGSKYFTDSYKLKSRLFRAKTRATIRKNEAIAAVAYFSTEDVVNLRPSDDNDPLQLGGARLHQALLQLRLTRPHPQGLPWFFTIMGAYQEAQTVGVVASYQSWLYNENKKLDRPEIMLLPVENYRFDAAADWRDVVHSSPYFIITWPVYVKDVKARMKEGRSDGKKSWRQYSDGEILAASQSFDTIRMAREGKGTDSKSANTSITDFSICWVHENFIEIDGQDVVFFTLGTERMLTDPELVLDVYPQGRPVTVGYSIVEAHKVYPSGVATLTRDTQSEINDIANMRIDNIKLMLNKRYFAARGKNVDLRSLTRNVPASVTMMDNPATDVRVITTDDATNSSYQEQDRLNLDFDDLSGVFSGSSVASNRGTGETVGGMQLLSANANQVSEYQLRTFTESWVEPTLRQIVELERAHESDDEILSAAAKMAGLEKLGFEQVSEALIMQDVFLTVNVGTGAVNPAMQVERFVYGMKALAGILGPDFLKKAKVEEVVKELFGKLGYKDGLRFFAMGEEEGTQDTELGAALQMIEQLQQALAQKNPPEVVAAQVAKMESETDLNKIKATLTRVEALFSAMSTAQTAVKIPGVTAVADEIAKSAGYVDQNAGTIYPQNVPVQTLPAGSMIPENSSPNFPAHPQSGMMQGIESGEVAPNVRFDNEQVTV